MNKKFIGALFVVVFTFSTVFIATIAIPGVSNVAENETHKSSYDSSANAIIYEDDSSTTKNDVSVSEGFYDDIGVIYDALTDDGLIIKVLRYHAPGYSFNYGTQPILLFPGLCCNINQYLQHTTPELEQYCDIELPEVLADWAQGDTNIEEDPMLYYSLAYYLWKIGYDPWFANYRGVGFDEAKSQNGDKNTCLDDFALYDVRAAVRKVYQVTNLHPFIGGHSTGGLTPIMFLQGCKYRWDGHVRSYDSLVKERNGKTDGPETIMGFIGLEPAWIPGMTKLLDNALIWLLLDTDLIIDLRGICELLLDIPFVGNVMDWLFEIMADKLGETITKLIFELANLDLTNTNAAWLFYFVAYAADKLYFNTLAQYLDFIAHDTVRESFKNGLLNSGLISPPTPWFWDGYYYYIDNVDKISVPAINFFASHQNQITDLVDSEKAIRDIVNGKTQTENDECYIIEGAHIDVPGGIRAPVDLFPKIGNWLAVI